jgi:cell division protein FtsB
MGGNMATEKYFADKKGILSSAMRAFVVLLFVFAVVFFLWSVMKYNQIMDEKAEKEAYLEEIQDEIDELKYLVEMPLDDAYKIRIARERLGMCFPDEIIYYTDMD